MPSWRDTANEVERLLDNQAIESLSAANAQQFISTAMTFVADCDAITANPYMNSVCLDWSKESLQLEIHSYAYELYALDTSPVDVREFTHKSGEQISNLMMGLLPKR